MKVIFLTDEYLPVPSSNGACVSRLVEEMPLGHNAYVLSVTRQNVVNNGAVTYVQYHRKPTSFKNKLIGFAQDTGFVNILFETAVKEIEEKNIDTVVCVYRPVETLITGLMLKRRFPNIKLVAYFLDNLCEYTKYNGIKTKIFIFNNKRLLKKVCRNFEKLVALKYYGQSMNAVLKNSEKLKLVGLPNLKKKCVASCNGKDRVKIIYTGSLSEVYRNPSGILDILCQIMQQDERFELHFFSVGCENILASYREKLGDRLQIHGLVPLQIAEKEISEADFLLNVANDLSFAVPGKLFEYFSTGKPVINFKQRENDPADKDYEKYPNLFTVYAYRQNDIQLLHRFISTPKDCIPFDILKSIYQDSTPEFTNNQILE